MINIRQKIRGKIKIYLFSIGILIAICSMYSCSTPIEEYQTKNEDEKQIIDLLKRYTKIINTGNTEKILTLFHENGVYVTGRGNVPLSREKMSKWKQEDWLSDGLRSLYNPEINIDGNEAAVMVQAKFGNYKTYKIFTLVKENDEWLIMRRE